MGSEASLGSSPVSEAFLFEADLNAPFSVSPCTLGVSL
jgi:hypothetical protein